VRRTNLGVVMTHSIAGAVSRMAVKQLVKFVLPFLLLVGTSPAFAEQDGSAALLIGNAVYTEAEAPLKEPVRDASALGDELRTRGFDVDVGKNLDKEQMRLALERFYAKIKPGSTAVFFFSGFGIQSDRQNYLIPVNAQIWTEADVRLDGYSIEMILNEMNGRGARVKIVILDASRRNPYEHRFRKESAGLAPMASPRGTLAITSALPGSVVSDDTPLLFTAHLLKELQSPDSTVEQVFRRTRMDVLRDTENRQVPWFSSSLDEDFALRSSSSAGPSLRPDLVTDCDRLAAHPSDGQRPPDVAGVFEQEIDIVAALRACNEAMRQYPDMARFVFEAGRIAHAQKNYAEALRLFEKAADMGSKIALTDTAIVYLKGQSVTKDYARARELFEEAGGKGDLLAVTLMGELYQSGEGVVQDYAQARQLYQRAADAGESLAINNLGVLYETGLGVPKDYTNARQWFEKAAAADNPEAMNNLGWLYQNGWGCPQDYVKARQFYERAATRGNPVAMNNLGSIYGEGLGVPKDYAMARAWYNKAAGAGNVAAMDILGVYYQNGWGGPQDYTKARTWFEKAADAGNAAAMNDLGVLYGRGLGVPQDYSQARNWYEKGAAAGNAVAMLNLGTFYLFGWGIPQDYSHARQWYEKAAAVGNAAAMNGLGALYEKGLDVPKDYNRARQWYEKGAAGGNDDAKKNVERLSR
jgi:TPR repeat protein